MARASPTTLVRLLDGVSGEARELAWAAFLREHSRLIYSAARRRAFDRDDAMDRYTAILEKLREDDYRKLRAFKDEGRGAFSTWLVVVSSRICVDHVRKKFGQRTGADPSPAQVARRNLVELAGPDVDALELSSESLPAPDAAVRQEERDSRLETALRGLEPEERLLIQLRFHDELPVREIAAVLGLPSPFHVYRRLDSIKAKLRESLLKKGVTSAEP